MQPNEIVLLAEKNNSWIEGHADEIGEKFEFYTIYFGSNLCSVSLVATDFSEIEDMFREVILNKDEER